MAVKHYTYCNTSLGKTVSFDCDITTGVFTNVVVGSACSGVQPVELDINIQFTTFGNVVKYLVPQNTSPYAKVVSSPTCAAVILSLGVANASLSTSSDGSVTINANAFATIQYSLDNINWQASNLFTGLPPGNYTAYVRAQDPNNYLPSYCNATPQPFTVGFNAVGCSSLSFNTVAKSGPTTLGGSDGYITVNTINAQYQVEYKLDSGAWQDSPSFTGLTENTYVLHARYKAYTYCEITQSVTIIHLQSCDIHIDLITITHEQTKFGKNGSIIVYASSSLSGLQYSKDNGATYQAGNIFTSLAPGTYTIKIKNSLAGCEASQIVIVYPFKAATVDFPNANGHRVVITTGPPADTGKQNYKNTLLVNMRFPDRETCDYCKWVQNTDIDSVQWRSNYLNHTLKLYNKADNSLVDTITCAKKSAYTNKSFVDTAYVTSGGGGKTQIWFANGLPDYYQVGMPITISSIAGMNGTYLINDILPGTLSAAGYQVLLLQTNYTPGAAISTGNISGTYNIEEWETWEAQINWSLYTTGQQFYFIVTGTDPQFENFNAQSEPCDLESSFYDSVVIEYQNNDNAFKIDYSTGIKNRLRIPGRLGFPVGGGAITGMEDSTRNYIKLEEYVTNLVDFLSWDVPFWIVQKVALAFAHDTLYVDGVSYAVEEKMTQTEYDHSILLDIKARLREEGYEADNSDDTGSSGDDINDVLATDSATLFKVTQ